MNRVTENLVVTFFGGLFVLGIVMFFAGHAREYSPSSCNTNAEALVAAVQFHHSTMQGGDFEKANQAFLQREGKIEVALVYRSEVPGLHTANYDVFTDCTVNFAL